MTPDPAAWVQALIEPVSRAAAAAAAPAVADAKRMDTKKSPKGVRVSSSSSATFRGNKAALPSKPCAACGRAMSWRRRWARSWAEVKYCSEACRRMKAARG